MNEFGKPLLAFLGSGGVGPHVEVIDLTSPSHETVSFNDLGPGGSVYSIAPIPARNIFATGTKSGRVYIFNPIANPRSGEFPYQASLIEHGAPILDICWGDGEQLVASDLDGNCILSDAHSPATPPICLETEGNTVCALWSMTNKAMVGLSTSGVLFFWNLLNGRLINRISGPVPPKKFASVRFVHWRARNALAYPIEGGQLALYDLSTRKISIHQCHTGSFFAIAELGEKLVTCGMKDALIKVWDSTMEKPIMQAKTPGTILSMAVLETDPQMLLAVNVKGSAEIYLLKNNKIESLYKVKGGDYRVAIGPTPTELESFHTWRTGEIAIKEMEDLIRTNREDGFEQLRDRLVSLGLTSKADKLMLKKSIAQKDLFQELQIRMQLWQRRFLEKPTREDFLRLARLLEHHCLFSEALEVIDELLVTFPNCWLPIIDRDLRNHRELVENGRWLAQWPKEINFGNIIRAVKECDVKLRGRYIIEIENFDSCPKSGLAPDIIRELYHQVMIDFHLTSWPEPTCEQLLWIDPKRIFQADILLFANHENPNLRGLEHAIQSESLLQETRLASVVLFNADCFGADTDSEYGQDLLTA